MRPYLRGRRNALIAFGCICALVAGGLGWVTHAALALEQEQADTRAQAEHAEKRRLWQREQEHRAELARREQQQRLAEAQAEFDARLRLALWRLDNRISPVLAREDARPYSHYSAIFAPSVVLDDKGTAYDEAQLSEPSPLLTAELPEWMLLHFQTTVEAGWGSPQVPPDDQVKQLVKNRIQLTNVTRDRRKQLRELAYNTSNARLLAQVEKEQQKWSAPGQQVDAVLQPLVPGKGQKGGEQGNVYNGGGYGQPQRQPGAKQDQDARQSYLLMENSKVFSQNAAYQGQLPLPKGSWQTSDNPLHCGEQVVIRLSHMGALWLPGEDQVGRLVVVRRVEILGRIPDWVLLQAAWPHGGLPVNLAAVGLCQYRKVPYPREVCQGVLLDWPKLQEILATEVADIFPSARFLPVRDETPPHPERTLHSLPVEIDPGESPAAVAAIPPEGEPEPELAEAVVEEWTPLRIGLALAWASSLVALGAVGLGGSSLLRLSERRIRFVSAVTHELRTPLTTLRLYLDMLTGGLVTEERQREEYLHILHQETDRLNRLVGNVLDFSRLENQRPRLEKQLVIVADLLEGVRADWETRSHDCRKHLVVDNRLGDRAMTTDLHLVQQILGTLIDNACKYSQGAEDPRLWLRAVEDGGGVALEVEDRGPGVPTGERRSIFQPFCRGNGADVIAGGVGLGLALAQRWTRLLGGTLTVHAGEGGTGARFRLTIPG
jgi:signal transduction histidine kinase